MPGSLPFAFSLGKATPNRDLRNRKDYDQLEGFLVPRNLDIQFDGHLHRPDGSTRIDVGRASGVVSLRDRNPVINDLRLISTRRDHPINAHFASRVPFEAICLRVTATCSLTRWQEGHYVVVAPPSDNDLEAAFLLLNRRIVEREQDKPLSVRQPPVPVITGDDGPWYRVQVAEPLQKLLYQQPRKRTLVNDEFLRWVWQTYMNAKRRGDRTTQAVAEWYVFNYGKEASEPSINRWIRQAKDRFGEEATDATHE